MRIATGVILLAVAGLAVSPLGRGVMFHVSPLRWTSEAPRLARLLELGPGKVVADIGAGDGSMAIEIAKVIGPGGRMFVTERLPEQRVRLAQRLAHVPGVVVLEAGVNETNLPDGCCDAIYLRMVWHHLTDRRAYAGSLARALRPGGRLVIIDFPPGAFFHLADDHGVTADAIIADLTSAGFSVQQRDDAWGRAFAIGFSY